MKPRHAYLKHPGGWPRIWRELVKRGIGVGKQRVQRLMQQHGIRARGKRRFRVATSDSRHDLPVAANRLNRNFRPAGLNQAWSGDITYIASQGVVVPGGGDRFVQSQGGGLV